MSHPVTDAELERMRRLVRGDASCPSCGADVHPDHDLCPFCLLGGEEVVVEPSSHEFLSGPPFADRKTVERLLAELDRRRQ